MTYREACENDIKQIFDVRFSVTENKLLPEDMVTEQLCKEYLSEKGKGWVCEHENQLVGFAIMDLIGDSIWALFVRPEFEGRGIGTSLYDLMLSWYFTQKQDRIWLVTEVNTRAELFYRKVGWTAATAPKNGEVGLELTYERWKEYLLR